MCPGRKASSEFAAGDEWLPVPPLEGAITCNIGDMLMRWSDDELVSTFHRVRAPALGTPEAGLPRFSIAYFNQCRESTLISGRPGGKYPALTGREFLQQARCPTVRMSVRTPQGALQRALPAAIAAAPVPPAQPAPGAGRARSQAVARNFSALEAKRRAAALWETPPTLDFDQAFPPGCQHALRAGQPPTPEQLALAASLDEARAAAAVLHPRRGAWPGVQSPGTHRAGGHAAPLRRGAEDREWAPHA